MSYSHGNGYDQAGGFDASSAQGEKKSATRGVSTITAMTIKQLNDGQISDGKIYVDNKEVGRVTLVGYVQSSDQSSNTQRRYTITDGTGQIEIRQFQDLEATTPANRHVADGVYVRAYGNIRLDEKGKLFTAESVMPISDHNQIVYHMMDVIATHNKNVKGKPMKQHHTDAPYNQAQQPLQSAYNGYNQQQYMQVEYNQQTPHPHNTANTNGNNAQQQIIAAFSNPAAGDNGVAIADVCAQLPHIPANDIRAAVTALCDEGVLYSTVDEEHYKATSS